MAIRKELNMKTRYIKLISALLILTALVSFCSCAKTYKDDLTASELADSIVTAVPVADGYSDAEDDFVDFNMPGVSSLCSEYIVKLSSSDIDMNEFGVFHAKSEKDAKEIAELCQKYLDKANNGMIGDYNPTELPKIEDSKVLIYGKYVIYTVLASSDCQLATDAVLAKIEK